MVCQTFVPSLQTMCSIVMGYVDISYRPSPRKGKTVLELDSFRLLWEEPGDCSNSKRRSSQYGSCRSHHQTQPFQYCIPCSIGLSKYDYLFLNGEMKLCQTCQLSQISHQSCDFSAGLKLSWVSRSNSQVLYLHENWTRSWPMGLVPVWELGYRGCLLVLYRHEGWAMY